MKEYKYPAQFYKLVTREEWNAVPAQTERLVPLHIPVPYIVTSWADTRPCYSSEECQGLVRKLQQVSLQRGLPDVEYNFLVGGDGQLYEGRGWDYEGAEYPHTMKHAEKLTGHSIQVAFLDRSSNNLEEIQIKTLSKIVTMGIQENLLSEKFKFYYHSEGESTFLHKHDVSREEDDRAKNKWNTGSRKRKEKNGTDKKKSKSSEGNKINNNIVD